MGSAQVGAIRRVVLGLVHAQERNARNVENLCASIAVSGRADSCWVEIALGEINFAYPHRKSPLGFLKGRKVKALPGLAVEAFEPGQYATLSFDPCEIEKLARFADALLTAVHALPAKDYGIDTRLAYLNVRTQHDWYLAIPRPRSRGAPKSRASKVRGPTAVTYRDRRPPASTHLVARLEQHVRRALPPAYRDYLTEQDGGRLSDNSEALNQILGLGDLPEFASLWHKLEVYADRVPYWLLPVATDAFGNLFAVSLRDEDNGSVWFWHHEEEADEDEPPTEDNIKLMAPDWPTFLASLQPADEA
jgi:cell wall assembly regulator SMI1